MGIEKLFTELIQTGGPIAAAIGVVLLVLFVGLKFTGVTAVFGERKTVVDDGKLSAVTTGIGRIESKLETVEQRIAVVERDVEARATRSEVHDIQLALAKFEGRMDLLAQIGKETNATVERIDGYMFDYGVRAAAARLRAKDEG